MFYILPTSGFTCWCSAHEGDPQPLASLYCEGELHMRDGSIVKG